MSKTIPCWSPSTGSGFTGMKSNEFSPVDQWNRHVLLIVSLTYIGALHLGLVLPDHSNLKWMTSLKSSLLLNIVVVQLYVNLTIDFFFIFILCKCILSSSVAFNETHLISKFSSHHTHNRQHTLKLHEALAISKIFLINFE